MAPVVTLVQGKGLGWAARRCGLASTPASASTFEGTSPLRKGKVTLRKRSGRGKGAGCVRVRYAKYERDRSTSGGGRRDEEGKGKGKGKETKWLEKALLRRGKADAKKVEDAYILGDVIGSGGYGVVREVECLSTGKKRALKSIQKKPRHFTGKASLYRAKVQTEFEAHLSLGRSLDVVYAFEAFEDDTSVHLVLELCGGGNLLSCRNFLQSGSYSEKQVASVLRTALRSIIQCNVHGLVFRDIKPENFLWTDQGHLKLSDFGLAAFCDEGEEDSLTERCGTVSFLAPEVIRQRYGQSCDVWSTGVMAYFLLSGHYPFRDEENENKVAKEIWRSALYEEPDFSSEPWEKVSDGAKNFVGLLLEKDPEKRISAKEALEHDWIKEDAFVSHDEVLEESLVARLQRFGLYGKLKQGLLQKTLGYLDPENEEVDKVNTFLRDLDYNNTGTVRVEDLVWMLSSGGYDLEADEWVQICDKIDGSSEGTLKVMDLAPFLVDWPKVQQSKEWKGSVQDLYTALCSSEVCSLEDVVKSVCESEDEPCSLEIVDEVAKILGSSDPMGSIELEKFLTLLKLSESELLRYYDSRLN